MTTRTIHEKLVDRVILEIDYVSGDTMVSPEEMLESLEWIKEELDDRIRAVEEKLDSLAQGLLKDPWFLRYSDGVYLFVENTSRARDVEEQVAWVFEERLGYPPRRVMKLAWGKWKAGPVRGERDGLQVQAS